MKTSPSSRRGRASREADSLIQLSEGLAQSGSRAEDRFWETRLDGEIDALLATGDEGSLNAALGRLADRESRAYEELADAIEGRVESAEVQTNEGSRDLLLFAAPVLAWSRMPLPTRLLSDPIIRSLKKSLAEEVFCEGVDLAVANYFFSPDQLPSSFGETAELRDQLAKALPSGVFEVDPQSLGETAQFLADQRYLLGVASVKKGAPLFADLRIRTKK